MSGKVVNMWVAPSDTDMTDLEAKMAEYGFNVITYDGIDDEEEGDEDDEE